jgi:hypothetical protein
MTWASSSSLEGYKNRKDAYSKEYWYDNIRK